MLVGHRKPLQLFGRSVVEWHKTHKNSNYVKLGSRFELSSPSRVDLTSRKVGLQTTRALNYLNRTLLGGGNTPLSALSIFFFASTSTSPFVNHIRPSEDYDEIDCMYKCKAHGCKATSRRSNDQCWSCLISTCAAATATTKPSICDTTSATGVDYSIVKL